jgi:diguanylate cyclase (GGDEF)-like protein/PAS domain S-box-containing protein
MSRPTQPDDSAEPWGKPPDTPRQVHDPAELRRIAEGRAALLPQAAPDSAAQLQALLHELQVHQIELEMQNEALQARLQIEESLARYTDLYELAPVAYFTLRRDGTIRQMNFAAAAMVALPLAALKGQRLGIYVAPEFRPVFNAFLEAVFAQADKQVGEIAFRRDGQPDLVAHVEAIADATGEMCRLGATDITGLKRVEQALRDSDERLRLVLLGANDGWWDWQLATDELYLSPRWLAMLGYAGGELATDAALLRRLMHPDDQARVERTLRNALEQGAENYELEFRLRHKDGHYVPVLSRAYITRDADGGARRVSGTDADLTARHAIDQERRLAQRVFACTGEAIMVTDPQGNIREVNPAFETITGYPRDEVLGKNTRMLQSDTQDGALYQGIWEALADAGHWRGEVWSRRRNGEVYPEWLTVSAIRDGQGRITDCVAIFSDISTMRAAQEQIEFLAHHDALTRLPNRLLFRERLEHALLRAQRHHRSLAVLFLDLDRFKGVNDALGHPVGDELLREIARRMSEVIRADDTLARLGGDEFVLLLEDDGGVNRVESVARKLLGVLAAPVVAGGHGLRVTVSIGASVYPDHGEDADTLLKHADQAMYEAKKYGRNRFHVYSPQLSGAALKRLVMETALRAAVGQDQLVLHLQPQIDLARHRLVGVEALVRWQHPQLGLMWPAQFIPLAEEIGVIGEIGSWVLLEACRQLVGLRAQGIDIPCIAVNLSAQQIAGYGLVGEVSAALAASGLRAEQLELEITESVIMERPEDARGVLEELRRLGVRIAVDDFGTGYSSLAYLRRLPLDRLKIDKSFVHDIGRDLGDEAITRAVIGLAASLGMETIAEGVEDDAQADFLADEGCSIGQGFHFCAPLPADELVTLLRARHFVPPAPGLSQA